MDFVGLQLSLSLSGLECGTGVCIHGHEMCTAAGQAMPRRHRPTFDRLFTRPAGRRHASTSTIQLVLLANFDRDALVGHLTGIWNRVDDKATHEGVHT